MNRYQDSNYLKQWQYKNSSNLNARAELHRLYSTNQADWFGWVADRLDLVPGMRILEGGCGPGWQWRNTLDRIPAECAITLTDLSAGMVAEAQAALADSGHDFRFEAASLTALPFEDDAFDLVVANHMLYHVPDLPQGLAEVVRVLKPGGRFVCATNGDAHMREVHKLRLDLLPGLEQARMGLAFTKENGRDQLQPFFSNIVWHEYPDRLEVTEVEPLIAYLLSIQPDEIEIDDARLSAVAQQIQEVFDRDGAYVIEKSVGLFVCRP